MKGTKGNQSRETVGDICNQSTFKRLRDYQPKAAAIVGGKSTRQLTERGPNPERNRESNTSTGTVTGSWSRRLDNQS